MELLETDLLSQESWIAFALRKRDLVAAGMVSGAVAGGAIAAALAGSSPPAIPSVILPDTPRLGSQLSLCSFLNQYW